MHKTIHELLFGCGFVRETKEGILSFISYGAEISDVINKIIPETNPRTELFDLSVYLYGFSPAPEKRKYDYDFFFFCEKLYKKSIKFINKNGDKENFILSYKYDPVETEDYINPCHFTFCVTDEAGTKLPRKAEKSSIQKHNKALVNFIFEEYLCNTVCLDKNLLNKWDIANNSLLNEFLEE